MPVVHSRSALLLLLLPISACQRGLVWLELDSVVMEDTRFTCKQLAATFAYDDPDDHIRRSFRAVFSYDNDLLSTAQNLCGRLASLDEYRNNDKRFGEDFFIQLLRDTAEQKN